MEISYLKFATSYILTEKEKDEGLLLKTVFRCNCGK